MDYAEVVRIDNAAINAIGDGLEGSNKPLVVTCGTLVVRLTGEVTAEESALWDNPINDRISSEQHALKLVKKGVKVSAIRLAPFVYGRGASGIRLFMIMFANGGEVFYVNEGNIKTSAVHVDDPAALFPLAAEKADAGDIFNASSISDVTTRELSEAMGSILGLPVKSFSYDDTVSKFGEFLSRFLNVDNRASGGKSKESVGLGSKGIEYHS